MSIHLSLDSTSSFHRSVYTYIGIYTLDSSCSSLSRYAFCLSIFLSSVCLVGHVESHSRDEKKVEALLVLPASSFFRMRVPVSLVAESSIS